MSTVNFQTSFASLASDVIHIFERTLVFFQNIGVLQTFTFNYSDILFNPSAEKYLENFITLLQEIKNVLDKLQLLSEQSKSTQLTTHPSDATNNTHQMVPSDLISASHFIHTSEIFVSEPLTVSHDVLGGFMAPTGLMNNHYLASEIVIEPTAEPPWTPAAEKDDDQEVEKSETDKPTTVAKDKFQCSICNKVLSSKGSLTNHQATHSGQKCFCCEHCGKLFTTSPNLAAHVTRQHNLNTESAHSCKECGKLFVRKSALDTHLKCHLGVKPFACSYCSKTFTQKVTRDTHQLTHTRDYKFCCDLCDKRFPTQAKLTFHRKTHGEPQHTCHLCDKKFTTRQYLNAHYRTHNVTRPAETAQCRLDTVLQQVPESSSFSCKQCGRSFPSQHLLTLHSQKHNPLSARYRYLEKRKMAPRQKHSCELCGKEFLLKASLSHHHRQQHATGLSERQKRPFSCHLCHKTFTLRAKARLHMQTHTQQAHHMCTVCGQQFLRKDSLRRHMALHGADAGDTGDGPYTCQVCGLVSATKATLKFHMKTHAAHYKCGRCHKSFRSKTALSYHTQNHDGNFKHQCTICGKQFVRNTHLKGHMAAHSTERPHKCEICGKTFKDTKHYREHIRRVRHDKLPPPPQIPPEDQLSVNQMSATQMTNELTAGQLAIHTLLAGDDATYGQTYDQFQACVQLQ
ncbi:oocyte zinc finger protein XlCOF6-like [Macrosteles quadrilineatus]|uniref:oocyte zinc finger protein XlCOF6-like n=1 Tax=Macrosteles quadrilineatus TaxID=74068 RepID=UPI0023E30369|nr:oocyte zinc finger protein XlCOF6-like [Macrosteles quadrilineatus]